MLTYAALLAVMAQNPEAAAPAAAPPAVEAPSPWAGTAGLGLAFITGNAETMTLTGSLALDKQWAPWALGIRLAGAWGLSNPTAAVAGSSQATTARRAGATVRGDRAFGAGFASLFVLAGSEFDHVKNIESRTIGEGGTGLTFLNAKENDFERLYLRLDLALRAGYETRFQYFPTRGPIDGNYGLPVLAPRAALAFRWGISKDVRVSEEVELIPFLLQPDLGRLLLNSTTKLNARLTTRLSVAFNVLVNYDSKPPQPAAPAAQRLATDVALTVGLEATL